MQTEAVFENIAERIQQEINKAQKSIHIAVAWFTNKNIFNELLIKANKGCTVSLIISNDEINEKSFIDYDLLNIDSSKVFKIGDGESELMHNKFCVIDYNTCISGSYNWSYKAEHNFENIIINSDDTQLAEQFIGEFNSIKNKYYPEETKKEVDFPIEIIVKRLEIIKNLILLEDIEDVNSGIKKLDIYTFNKDIELIIENIRLQKYSKAVQQIQKFINSYQSLSIWNDPEVAALKLEIKILENKLNAFDNEKIELEKILSDFQYKHTHELGEIILKILKLRKQIHNDNPKKAKEADKDYEEYNKQFNLEKEKIKFDITKEDKKILKTNFRKATTLCHPDKVMDEQKDEAQKVFISLKEAYDQQDIKTVNKILKDLESGNLFHSQSDTISEKQKLQAVYNTLQMKLEQLKKEIINIKNSDIFNTINSIDDWDNYFKETKESLEQELEELSLEINN